ncbi:MAG: hypothetical protein KatS3mg054_0670 [Chloroflexus sp.]|jgi:hypothetical protein|nr:MAG: hypothetical protein KatS3mg047_1073 [Bellilinea sp.]GIV86641.1 MAG: hypothetical protein KatS3mg054_0670 [Chloroflexus sp.]
MVTINCENILTSYQKYLNDNIICYPEGNYIAIETPYLYSDGDMISLYVERRGDELFLTDLGETFRHLAIHNINWNTKKIQSLLYKILHKTGVSNNRGVLSIKITTEDEIAHLISDLVHAVQQTENLVFTLKDHVPKSFRDEVEIFLIERGYTPEINYQIDGESGNQWRVHFFVNHRKNVLIRAISASTKGGARYQAISTYAMYDDIKKRHPQLRRAAILDDSNMEVWEPENINLINAVLDLNLVYWQEREILSAQINLLEED